MLHNTVQIRGRGHLVQFGQRRQQAVAADLRPDRRARSTRSWSTRRRPTGLNGILTQATRARHPRRLVRQHRHRAHRRSRSTPTSSRSAGQLAEWLAKKLGGKGNVIMVTGVAGTSVDQDRNKGADERLGEESRHQGRQPLHRHVGFGDRRAQHRRDPAVAAEDRRHLVPGRHRRRAQGVHRRQAARCRRPRARPRTASASS